MSEVLMKNSATDPIGSPWDEYINSEAFVRLKPIQPSPFFGIV